MERVKARHTTLRWLKNIGNNWKYTMTTKIKEELIDFEKRMFITYPLLYKDMYGDIRTTCMAWGFDIGPGWYSLIEELSSKLEPLIQKFKDENPGDYWIRASQVKEKYGIFCFYMTSATEEMWTLIEEAEEASEHICEECGNNGKLRGLHWYKTLCDKCAVDYKG
jgi:hypothetical protein